MTPSGHNSFFMWFYIPNTKKILHELNTIYRTNLIRSELIWIFCYMVTLAHCNKCPVLLIGNNRSSFFYNQFRIQYWSDELYPLKCNFRLHVNRIWNVVCLPIKISSDKSIIWLNIRLERIKKNILFNQVLYLITYAVSDPIKYSMKK